MKQTELNLDQLQQIKGGSKFWGEECTPDVDSYEEVPQEYIDGVPNHFVPTCTSTCNYYVFGIVVDRNYTKTTKCGFENFGL